MSTMKDYDEAELLTWRQAILSSLDIKTDRIKMLLTSKRQKKEQTGTSVSTHLVLKSEAIKGTRCCRIEDYNAIHGARHRKTERIICKKMP